MLPYFPTPYQDELLYSVIARYGVHCGITSAKELLRDLFNQSDVAAVIDFPGHLKTLKECLGNACSLSIDDLIQHHTLYHAFHPIQNKIALIFQNSFFYCYSLVESGEDSEKAL